MKIPPIMGAAMRFITSEPVADGPHDGNEPQQQRGHGHELGPDPFGRPLDNGLVQLGQGVAGGLPVLAWS